MAKIFRWNRERTSPEAHLSSGKSPRGEVELPYPEHSRNTPLSIHDLTVAYERKPVVWDVDLEIPEGHLVGVIGPNGAGKSTLIKACLDIIKRVSGEVLFYGEPYRKQRKKIGYVPQRESVDWDFPISALEVVAMGTYGRLGWCRPVGKRCRELARHALERVGLADYANRQISQLSGGQQQRVFLARALAQEASIYFMDEPFAAVDASTERAIVRLLEEIRAENKTCLVVHHDLATVSQYFDYLIMMNMRVVVAGPTQEVFTEENLRKTYGGNLTVLSRASSEVSRLE